MPVKQVPLTTPINYISGLHSLNLDLEDGTMPDWHFSSYWMGTTPITLYGQGTDTDTTILLGKMGIRNRASILIKAGIQTNIAYVADHYRAIADLTYSSIKKTGRIGYLKGSIDNYLKNDNQKLKLISILRKLYVRMDEEEREVLDDWIRRELKPLSRPEDNRAIQIRANLLNAQNIRDIK